jgi:hypothetical protein
MWLREAGSSAGCCLPPYRRAYATTNSAPGTEALGDLVTFGELSARVGIGDVSLPRER